MNRHALRSAAFPKFATLAIAGAFFALGALTGAQPPSVSFPADRVFETIRERSVHGAKVDWAALESRYRTALPKGPGPAVVSVFEALGDVHSSIVISGERLAYWEGLSPERYDEVRPLLDFARGEGAVIRTDWIGSGSIAYLSVPAMNIDAPQVPASAEALREAVLHLADRSPRGWIVDLRWNSGGNAYPMLLGLRPLLGVGLVGTSRDVTGAIRSPVTLTSGSLAIDGTPVAELPSDFEPPLADAPVVVLIGPLTASSGVMTALAFRGRPRTILLGEPTAPGYATGNEPFLFEDGTFMNLATGHLADRDDRAAEGTLAPDQTVVGDAPGSLWGDPKVKAALETLSSLIH